MPKKGAFYRQHALCVDMRVDVYAAGNEPPHGARFRGTVIRMNKRLGTVTLKELKPCKS